MAKQRVSVALRWSDMDAYGHVNNVKYLQLLEEARVELLAADLMESGGPDVGGTGLIVSRSEIEYMAPMTYRPRPIAVDLWVTRIGAADFDMAFVLLDPDADGVVFAVAETSLVTLDLATQRPRRITADEKARLQGWSDGPVQWRRRRKAG